MCHRKHFDPMLLCDAKMHTKPSKRLRPNPTSNLISILALTELFIEEKKRGACRIHGGGFAGVIMAMLPNDLVDEYVAFIEKALGEGSAYRMTIRPYGAICVNDEI